MKITKSNKKGFTIIEVVLVLAIAGLIFMMVFIALPALQRSQRDQQRSNDVSRVQTALNQYQSNNRGAIPTTGTYISGHAGQQSSNNVTTSWAYFYDKYLIVNSAGANDSFADPDGSPYSLWIVSCGTTTANTNCPNGQRNTVTFDAQSQGSLPNESSLTPVNTGGSKGHSISVVTNATCRGEMAIYSSGARKVALLYKREGGGVICVNN